jgi:hypothetical protein
MFMSTWDNPDALAKAWRLWEIYCCRSCGGRAEFVLPRMQREQLHDDDTLTSRPVYFTYSCYTLRK